MPTAMERLNALKGNMTAAKNTAPAVAPVTANTLKPMERLNALKGVMKPAKTFQAQQPVQNQTAAQALSLFKPQIQHNMD